MSRKPKPDAVKKIEGSRDRLKSGDQVEVRALLKEDFDELWINDLADDARIYFFEYYELLSAKRVISELDIQALKILADSTAMYWCAQDSIREKGYLIKGRGRTMVKNPAISIKAMAWDRVKTLLAEFGMTPSSRAKISPISSNGSSGEFGQLLKMFSGDE